MILEIVEGPETGRRVKLREGSTVSFGRTESAMEKFAGDTEMSALHFVVSLSAGMLRVQNHSRTNGSHINGARVETAVLKSDDTIRAGATVFAVIGPPPNPYPAQVRMGGWGLNIIPDGWKPMDGIGLIREDAGFRANAAGLEESLPEAKMLRAYIDVQIEVAKSQLKAAEIEGPVEASMEGADEALLLTVSSDTKDGGRVTQRQIYARSGDVVGILTMTGSAAANQDFIEIVRGASFHKPQIPG
jgi:type III secretion system (T3SS) inner membrane Yop/YscD-like protein